MKKFLCALLMCCMLPKGQAFGAELEINAKSALLMSFADGRVLYELNADEQLPLASVTKIMTLLLTMEAMDSGALTGETIVRASERAKSMGGSTIFLDAGEEMRADDLIKGVAVASGNDACVALAEHLCQSEEAFVEKMNLKAAELGMKNTHFVNCNGLDAENHYSSARDIAIMSRALMEHKEIFKYTGIWMDSLRDGKFYLANTNKLIRFYDGATGLKTGSTNKALCCISATAKRNGLHLIAVVMGSPDSKSRFTAARKLLDYGFEKYGACVLGEKGKTLTTAEVKKGKKDKIPLLSERDCSVCVPTGRMSDVEIKINPLPLIAPVKKGDKAGEAVALLDGEKIASCPLVVGEAVEKRKTMDYFASVLRLVLRS